MSANVLFEGHSAPRDDLKELTTLAEAATAFFGTSSPKLMAAAVMTSGALRLAIGGWSFFDLAAAASIVVFWCLFEWGAHLVLLHAKPRKVFGRTFDPLYARYHRAHHKEPWSLRWVLVPARFIGLAFVASGALFWLVFPTPALAVTAWLSFCLMAFVYEWNHMLTHTRYKPRTKLVRALWRNHRLHHFKNENYWFGLTTTLADHAFGTAPAMSDVPKSTTTRTLGVEEID